MAEAKAPADITPAELAELRATIEQYEKAEAQRETGAFEGVARCINSGCEMYDTSVPIALIKNVTEVRAPDIPALVLSATESLAALDDSDLPCPKCSAPRAIMPVAPPQYAKQVF